MYLEARAAMSPCTKRQKQWLWFIGLWLGGLGSVMLLSSIIKFVMQIA